MEIVSWFILPLLMMMAQFASGRTLYGNFVQNPEFDISNGQYNDEIQTFLVDLGPKPTILAQNRASWNEHPRRFMPSLPDYQSAWTPITAKPRKALRPITQKKTSVLSWIQDSVFGKNENGDQNFTWQPIDKSMYYFIEDGRRPSSSLR